MNWLRRRAEKRRLHRDWGKALRINDQLRRALELEQKADEMLFQSDIVIRAVDHLAALGGVSPDQAKIDRLKVTSARNQAIHVKQYVAQVRAQTRGA